MRTTANKSIRLKYLLTESFIFAPYRLHITANKKNRAPRAIIEAITNGPKEILQKPAARVAAL